MNLPFHGASGNDKCRAETRGSASIERFPENHKGTFRGHLLIRVSDMLSSFLSA
jgi:hypothetical protein